MDRRTHADPYQQQSFSQHRANKNKRKNFPRAGAENSTHRPPPLGRPGSTPADHLKQMQKEREQQQHAAGTAAGVGRGHVGDGDHADVNSNNNEAGSSTAKGIEVIDNSHNANGAELSPSSSRSGFVSASEGDDTMFGNANSNANANLNNLNNSNSSSASATFTDARDNSDDTVEVSYQKKSEVDARNGNTDADADEGLEYDDDEEGDESNTPHAEEEYTHASLIVNLSNDNSSIDFREHRARVDLTLPEDPEPLSSARSAPPDLSHEDHEEEDEEVQYLYSSTPSRPQPKPVGDSIPVVTLDSTLELENSVSSNTNGCHEGLNESKSAEGVQGPSGVSHVSAAEVSSTSNDANTTSTTLDHEELKDKSKTASLAETISTTRQAEESAVEEVQAPEVAAEVGFPKTVTVLQATNGTTVYLVGTAHFSEASQDDVIKTIQEAQPKLVFLELCQARQHILVYDEETILREASDLGLEKIRYTIKRSGLVQGALHLLLLSISSSITKKLGMAPGGEFRVGYREAQQLGHKCDIIFGDRAFAVTLARALDSLTFWQKMKLAWQFLTTPNDITKEEIERCKEKDILEQMLEEMVGEYPSISHVFVGERDIFLAHSLWLSALATDGPVVGIVGIGHVPGITKHWGRTNEAQVNEVNQMPKTSTTSLVVRKTIRIGFYCLVGYGAYRLGSRMIAGTRIQSILLPEALTSRLGSLKLSTFAKKY